MVQYSIVQYSIWQSSIVEYTIGQSSLVQYCVQVCNIVGCFQIQVLLVFSKVKVALGFGPNVVICFLADRHSENAIKICSSVLGAFAHRCHLSHNPLNGGNWIRRVTTAIILDMPSHTYVRLLGTKSSKELRDFDKWAVIIHQHTIEQLF